MIDDNTLIEEIRQASSRDQLFDSLSKMEFGTSSSRLSSIVDKKLKQIGGKSDIRIALLSNFTVDLVSPYITTAFAALELVSECYIAPSNQYYQEVLSEKSKLKTFQPDIILLSLEMSECSSDLRYRFSELSEEQRLEQADFILGHITDWIKLAIDALKSNILVTNFVAPQIPHLGIGDNFEAETEREFYQKLNNKLRLSLKDIDRAHVLDIDALIALVGWERAYDAKMYYLAKIIWSDHMSMLVGQSIAKFAVAVSGYTKKCLILDLDNTLWGGVLGEEGINGIKIGQGDSASEVYTDFQYKIKSLKNRGVVLALCSKNNYDDVSEVFSHRKGMPLQLNDFAAIRINWQPKHQNIKEIGAELNIGLDSLVFIDDNPVEVNLVREMLPEVKCLLLPNTIENIPAFLDFVPYFEKISILEEDRQKTELYNQNKKRVKLKKGRPNLEDYLISLETKVTLRAAGNDDVQRLHQLFTKTNQFNITTIRYSVSDIRGFLGDQNCDLWCFTVGDKFGELGIVGLLLIRRDQYSADLDSFIMSCRVMGRGVETAVLNWAKEFYIERHAMFDINSKYIPTKKNLPVKDLFIEQGFEVISESERECVYKLTAEKKSLIKCDWINLISRV